MHASPEDGTLSEQINVPALVLLLAFMVVILLLDFILPGLVPAGNPLGPNSSAGF